MAVQDEEFVRDLPACGAPPEAETQPKIRPKALGATRLSGQSLADAVKADKVARRRAKKRDKEAVRKARHRALHVPGQVEEQAPDQVRGCTVSVPERPAETPVAVVSGIGAPGAAPTSGLPGPGSALCLAGMTEGRDQGGSVHGAATSSASFSQMSSPPCAGIQSSPRADQASGAEEAFAVFPKDSGRGLDVTEAGSPHKAGTTGENGVGPGLSGAGASGTKDVHTSDPPESLIPRLYAACASQVARIEARLKALMPEEGDLSEIDKTVKTLAGMAKTLELLIELERERAKEAAAQTDAGKTIDPDTLRSELAQRISGLCGSGADGGGPSKPEHGGDAGAFEGLGVSRP